MNNLNQTRQMKELRQNNCKEGSTGNHFACSDIYICVKNGKVIKVMDEA